MITVLGNDKNEPFTLLEVTNLETGRQHKHKCYDDDETDYLAFYRSQYTDTSKYYVHEMRYESCTHAKMAL